MGQGGAPVGISRGVTDAMQVSWLIGDHYKERTYLRGILAHLAADPVARDLSYVVADARDAPLAAYGEHVVALLTSDESYQVPRFSDRVAIVLKSYLKREGFYANLFPLPLGCSADIPDVPLVPFEARNIDVFFSGQEHVEQRRPFFAHLEGLERRCSGATILVRRTARFGEGYSGAEYARLMMDSRIALCPPGLSVETFRWYEAMRAGCVVISSRQPDHGLYRGSPAVQVDNWRHLPRLVARLLADPDRLRRLHEETLVWWRTRYAEAAVARYIAERIVERRAGLPPGAWPRGRAWLRRVGNRFWYPRT